MARLKSVSGIRHRRFTKLHAIKCFEAFRERLLAGWPVNQLVRFIQVDNKELTDLDPKKVSAMVVGYQRSLPPAAFMKPPAPPDIVNQRMTPIHDRAISTISKGLDEIQELEKLFRLQLERIDIDLAVERHQKKLIPSMTQEVRIAKELLESSARLKMDLGLKTRHLGVMETEARITTEVVEKYGDARVASALGDSQSRQRLAGVVAAFERFMLADGESDSEQADLMNELEKLIPIETEGVVVDAQAKGPEDEEKDEDEEEDTEDEFKPGEEDPLDDDLLDGDQDDEEGGDPGDTL